MTRNEASRLQHNLHQLTSSSEHKREQALQAVSMHICHEGFISDYTAEAIPFLIDLLNKSHVKGKDGILALLADIAWADSELTWQWQNTGEAGEQPMTEEHLVVATGLATYLKLLSEPDPAIQLQATYALSQFPEKADELTPSLIEAYMQTQDIRIQTNLILAPGALCAPLTGGNYTSNPIRQRPAYKNDAWTFCEHIWHTATHELLAFCAALVLARFAGKDTPQEVVSLLTTIMMTQDHSDELNMLATLPCHMDYAGDSTIAATLALKELA